MSTLHKVFNRRFPIVIVAVLLFLASTVVACGNSNTQDSGPQGGGPIEPTWIQAEVTDNMVSILLSEVETNRMTHFTVNTSGEEMDFMSYELSGDTYVRASICPPCYSRSFALVGDTLVCDRCGTVFNAKTGSGISGACLNYPKASVPFEINGNSIIMGVDDLVTAYNNTIEPGLP